MTDLPETFARLLRDPGAGWSMGSFGAIAEFHQDPGETALLEGPLLRATARGAIRIDRLEGLRPVAYETLSPRPERWGQGVALCLPEAEAARPRRKVLTELGPDREAIRPEDREGVLFDMGLDQPQVEFCIRTAAPDLLALLRAAEGRSLFEPGSTVMGAILAAHPHRVALTALGRCEVFQKIGGADTGGVSPPGPHTHVLPKLLASGRTHSANTPIPGGLIPCAGLHPASPVAGSMGEDRAFDPALFDAFQDLLAAWGPPRYLQVKREVWGALDAGTRPQDWTPPADRLGRHALRNALRQRLRAAPGDAVASAWRDVFDARAVAEDDPDPTGPHA